MLACERVFVAVQVLKNVSLDSFKSGPVPLLRRTLQYEGNSFKGCITFERDICPSSEISKTTCHVSLKLCKALESATPLAHIMRDLF